MIIIDAGSILGLIGDIVIGIVVIAFAIWCLKKIVDMFDYFSASSRKFRREQAERQVKDAEVAEKTRRKNLSAEERRLEDKRELARKKRGKTMIIVLIVILALYVILMLPYMF